jgi:hypothetical protein
MRKVGSLMTVVALAIVASGCSFVSGGIAKQDMQCQSKTGGFAVFADCTKATVELNAPTEFLQSSRKDTLYSRIDRLTTDVGTEAMGEDEAHWRLQRAISVANLDATWWDRNRVFFGATVADFAISTVRAAIGMEEDDAFCPVNQVKVETYYRDDGELMAAHCRPRPENTCSAGVNPYTGLGRASCPAW